MTLVLYFKCVSPKYMVLSMKRKFVVMLASMLLLLTISTTALAEKTYKCDFKADKTAGWAPFHPIIIATTDETTNNIQLWQWTLKPVPSPDKTTMWVSNTPFRIAPTLIYNSYNVQLDIHTKTGMVVECRKPNYFTVYHNIFTYKIPDVTKPKIVTFTYTGTGNPTSFNWDFGDKSKAQNKNLVTHLYKKAGTYTARLKVKNSAGSSTVSQSVIIR